MKKLNRFLTGFFAMCIIAGCSDDRMTGDGAENGVDNPKDAAYLSVSVSLPSKGAGTRSQTNTGGGSDAVPGTEVGLDRENEVKEILLVLATPENKYGAHALLEYMTQTKDNNYKATGTIGRTLINKFYDSDGNLKSGLQDGIHVYVFCNPTAALVEILDDMQYEADWIDEKCELQDSDKENFIGWKGGSFLMSNYAVAKRKIPQQFDTWRNQYAVEDNAFDLTGLNGAGINNSVTGGGGPIQVERSVARFDFKDGSANPTTAPNTYGILNEEGQESGIQVQLVRMALVNMSKKFYYLRRVSDNGKPDGNNFGICGLEHSANYVVDTDCDFKLWSFENNPNVAQLHDHFYYPLFTLKGEIDTEARKQWDNYRIADVLAQDEDNPDYTPTGYHIWRYVTENTIPFGQEVQREGISTGVIFKGKLKVSDALQTSASDLYNAVNGNYTNTEGDYIDRIDNKDYPILYNFRNNLYVGWNAGVMKMVDNNDPLKAAATDGGEQSPNELYKAWVNETNQTKRKEAFETFRKAAVAAGFTLYQASDDAESDTSADKSENDGVGYYFYYEYWNRHNDNGWDGTMGPMEFAVVRNNVYKLAVTKISKLGHPRVTGNDPDPLDPDKPDERGDVYLTVSVEVLPWVVRENNIEF